MPPSCGGKDRVIGFFSAGNIAKYADHHGWARLWRTKVINTRLISTIFGDQRVPIEGAQQRPCRYSTDVNSLYHQCSCGIVLLYKPTCLFLTGATIVKFRQSHWKPKPLPCFPQQAPYA